MAFTSRPCRIRRFRPRRLPAAWAIACALIITTAAWAQQQPSAAPPSDPALAVLGSPGRPLSSETAIDYREAMRQFVIRFAETAREARPDFIVVAPNGLDLLVKEDPLTATEAPARRYIKALDGLMVTNLDFAVKSPDSDVEAKQREHRLDRAKLAKAHGLRVLALDGATKPKSINASWRAARGHGFASFSLDPTPSKPRLLPPYPARPFLENSRNVLSLHAVENFAVLPVPTTTFGRQDEVALALHRTNYDLLVVSPFHHRKALSQQTVETLKYKNLGARRLVLAHINIGTAASYRYYWEAGWREDAPAWIGPPISGDPDRYIVRYWQSGWQELIAAPTGSFLHGILDRGFDGVVLDGLDAFYFFETGDLPPEGL